MKIRSILPAMRQSFFGPPLYLAAIVAAIRAVRMRRRAISGTRHCAPETAARSSATRIVTRIFPTLRHFSPDLMLISAGFDAHAGDPLADLRLLEPRLRVDYEKTGRSRAPALPRANHIIPRRGGYLLTALAQSTAAHVAALMEGANQRSQSRNARLGAGQVNHSDARA